MKKRNILLSVLLAMLLVFAAACQSGDKGTNGTGGNGGSAAVVEFWSAPITEKVLSDQPVSAYANVKRAAALYVEAAKDEYESGQILMSAAGDVKAYDVVLSDLKCGSEVYSKENVEVYNQKYIEVKTAHPNSRPLYPSNGFFPDALLPFYAAKKAGENRIAKNANQGVWFEFYVPRGIAAGVYTGEFTITYDGASKKIPVELYVRDFTISEVTHSKSYMSMDDNWCMSFGEMDSTDEMKNAYNYFLSKYRLSGGQFFYGGGKLANMRDDGMIDKWLDAVWDWAKNPRNASLALPYEFTSDSNVNQNRLRDTIVAFARKCLDENLNVVDKLLGYYTMIDEPDMFGSASHVQAVTDRVKAAITAAANIIQNDSSITSPLKSEVVASIRGIKSVVPVGGYSSSLSPYIKDGFVWCPKIGNYDTNTPNSAFTSQEEQWWYTCVGPQHPYPTYVLEAAGYSPRIFDWAAQKYGVTGNLYWACNFNRLDDGSHLEDYYETAMRSVGTNGEAFLVYPGKPYGIYGPVGSVRLHAARDGIEDKEVLYALENGYKAYGAAAGKTFKPQEILGYLYDQILDGVRIYTTSDRFFKVRRTLYDLAEMFESDAKLAITEYSVSGANVNMKIAIRNGFDLKVDGQPATVAEVSGSGPNAVKIYNVSKTKALQTNIIALTVVSPAGEKTFTLDLGGSVVNTSPAELEGGVTAATGGTVDLATVSSVQYVRAQLTKDANATQRITIEGAFLDNIGRNTDWITIALGRAAYSFGGNNAAVTYSVCFEYENSSLYYEIASGTLPAVSITSSAAKFETVTVRNLYAFSWQYGEVKKIHVYFGAKGDNARTVYVGGVSVAML